MSVEIRCPNEILFGILEDRVLEVKCKSSRCGARSGVVILHRFDAQTGQLLDTRSFRDPLKKERQEGNAVG